MKYFRTFDTPESYQNFKSGTKRRVLSYHPDVPGEHVHLDTSDYEIYYTTTNGQKITLDEDVDFGAEIVEHDYPKYEGNISFEEKPTTIPSGAFAEQETLKEIVIPSDVDTIESGAFENCENLDKITIKGEDVTVEQGAFAGVAENGHLIVENEEILKDNNVVNYEFSGWTAYDNTGKLIGDVNVNTIVYSANGSDGVITINSNYAPANSLVISYFNGDSNVIPQRNESDDYEEDGVHYYAYTHTSNYYTYQIFIENNEVGEYENARLWYDMGCGKYSMIASYKITGKEPNYQSQKEVFNVKSGENQVIKTDSVINSINCENNSSITSIKIPSNVTSIENRAFANCYNLEYIEIPNGITSIGNDAFVHCLNLSNIDIPEKVTVINDNVFFGCSSLKSIIIPEQITSIGTTSFATCTNLAGIIIPANVTSIGYSTFSDCWNMNSMIVDSNNIKYDSRNNCNAIIETSTNTLIYGCNKTIIPNSVTSIRFNAFSGCNNMTSINIPEGVVSIGDSAFYNCNNLKSVNIPRSVTSIYSNTFQNCNNLTDVYYNGSKSQWNSLNCKFNSESIIVHCTDGDVVNEMHQYIWTDGDGNVHHTNSMSNTDKNNAKSVIITGINSSNISRREFYGNSNIESIIIGDNITYIGQEAFYNCSGANNIEISNSVNTIDSYAFSWCDGVTDITIPDTVTTINTYAFANVPHITYHGTATGAPWGAYSMN